MGDEAGTRFAVRGRNARAEWAARYAGDKGQRVATRAVKKQSSTVKPIAAQDPLWFKDAIVYQLHVRAFNDSNGDGIGDFPGLTEKLDYIQDLGVTAIWLLPFFLSPLRDDGYDIADYTRINPA